MIHNKRILLKYYEVLLPCAQMQLNLVTTSFNFTPLNKNLISILLSKTENNSSH